MKPGSKKLSGRHNPAGMSISQFAEVSGLSADTLRYYEKIGILRAPRRSHSGHRLYSDQEIKWIEFVNRLKRTDMSLSEIQRYAALRVLGDTTLKDRLEMLEQHQRLLIDRINSLQQSSEKIKEKIDWYKAQMNLLDLE